MKTVKTVKAHNNAHGSKFEKKRGFVYEHPNPTADIKAGFVKEVEADDVQSKSGGLQGHGEKPVSSKDNDSEIDGAAGDEKSSRANKGARGTKSAG